MRTQLSAHQAAKLVAVTLDANATTTALTPLLQPLVQTSQLRNLPTSTPRNQPADAAPDRDAAPLDGEDGLDEDDWDDCDALGSNGVAWQSVHPPLPPPQPVFATPPPVVAAPPPQPAPLDNEPIVWPEACFICGQAEKEGNGDVIVCQKRACSRGYHTLCLPVHERPVAECVIANVQQWCCHHCRPAARPGAVQHGHLAFSPSAGADVPAPSPQAEATDTEVILRFPFGAILMGQALAGVQFTGKPAISADAALHRMLYLHEEDAEGYTALCCLLRMVPCQHLCCLRRAAKGGLPAATGAHRSPLAVSRRCVPLLAWRTQCSAGVPRGSAVL